MNKSIFIGNLARDPQLRSTTSGIQVCTFTVVVNGKKKEDQPTYVSCTAWRVQAENCGKYLTKGSKVCVTGPIALESYDSKKTGQKVFYIALQCQEVQFLSERRQVAQNANKQPQNANERVQEFIPVNMDDELPF